MTGSTVSNEKTPQPPSESPTKRPLSLVIDNKLYDLTNFAKVHPGGEQLLEEFNETDASEYFYAIHSKEAAKKLSLLKNTELPPDHKIPKKPYFELEARLYKDGFFRPNYYIELLLCGHTLFLYLYAAFLNQDYPFLACIVLGISHMSAGWTGHHFEHSRDSPVRRLGRFFSPIITGFSPTWWSTKHNRHHVSCNEVDLDGDIRLVPFLWLWKVTKKLDRWNRRFQHLYFGFLYAVLHFKWQYDSVITAFKLKIKQEMFLITLHFILYALFFKVKVVLFAVLIAGFLTGFVVTSNHQGEEKVYSKKQALGGKENNTPANPFQIHDYAEHQLITTRNITTYNWVLNYICGGMQFQIEHHLFPRIPLYKLAQVRPYVMDFCQENNIEYKEEGFWQMMYRNYKTVEIHAFMEF